jgi:hypothetical protein
MYLSELKDFIDEQIAITHARSPKPEPSTERPQFQTSQITHLYQIKE